MRSGHEVDDPTSSFFVPAARLLTTTALGPPKGLEKYSILPRLFELEWVTRGCAGEEGVGRELLASWGVPKGITRFSVDLLRSWLVVVVKGKGPATLQVTRGRRARDEKGGVWFNV